MIDFASEQVVTLANATKILPERKEGKRPNVATIYRWTTRGVKGIVLETIQIGGSRCTSVEALQRFFEQLSLRSQALPLLPPPMSPSARIRCESARRELIAMGVKCGGSEPRHSSAVPRLAKSLSRTEAVESPAQPSFGP